MAFGGELSAAATWHAASSAGIWLVAKRENGGNSEVLLYESGLRQNRRAFNPEIG